MFKHWEVSYIIVYKSCYMLTDISNDYVLSQCLFSRQTSAILQHIVHHSALVVDYLIAASNLIPSQHPLNERTITKYVNGTQACSTSNGLPLSVISGLPEVTSYQGMPSEGFPRIYKRVSPRVLQVNHYFLTLPLIICSHPEHGSVQT